MTSSELDALYHVSWAKQIDGSGIECGVCGKLLAVPAANHTFEIHDVICFIYDKNDTPIDVMCESCERNWLEA